MCSSVAFDFGSMDKKTFVFLDLLGQNTNHNNKISTVFGGWKL